VEAVKSWEDRGTREDDPIHWWVPGQRINPPFEVGSFVGQGREMWYTGVSYAIMEKCTYDQMVDHPDDFKTRVEEIVTRLDRLPPWSWYFTALVALLIVWAGINMALLLAYNTPTIGLGCWSGSFLIYGVLSSVSWFVQLFNSRKTVVTWICHAFNCVAFLWLVVVTFLMVSHFSS
jgi:hypothetical protein